MNQPFNQFSFGGRNQVILLFGVALVLLLAGLGSNQIYILDEARNAQAAREMMLHNEWIVPTFNGELRPHKPPLHYWFMRAGFNLFGINAFGARFFSAIMGWLTILISWYFTRRFVNAKAALWSAIALLVSTHFLFEFRLAVPDPYLIFFITAGTLCSYAYIKEEKLLWLLLSAVAFACATLAKGPVALALPGVAIAVWLLLQKKFIAIFNWRILLFVFVLVAVAMPWYIAIHKATNSAFTKAFFLEHNIGRFGGAMEGHGGIFLLVPLFVFVGILPFSIYSIEAFKKWKQIIANDFQLLAICMVAAIIIFFSISGTKLPNYPMPCYPFVAIIIGCYLQQTIALKKYPLLVLSILNLLLLIAAFIGLGIEPATAIAKWWAFIFIIPFAACAVAWWLSKSKKTDRSLNIVTISYIAFNFLFLAFAYPGIYQLNPVTKTQHLLQPEEQVYAYQIYNPAYNFHLNKPVIVLESRQAMDSLLQNNKTAKIITREENLKQLEGLPYKIIAKERDLFELPVTVIINSQ